MKCSGLQLIFTMVLLLIFFIHPLAQSEATDVYIDITSSEVRKVTIGIPYFHVPLNQPELLSFRDDALKILSFDLRESGLFQIVDLAPHSGEINSLYLRQRTLPFSEWYMTGTQAVVVGDLSASGENLIFNAALFDVKMEMMMTGKKYTGTKSLYRGMIHKFADEIIYRYTGEKGIAHTKIVYVEEKGTAKELVMMDYDGHNKEQITNNGSINLMPTWSPDGEFIYYSSYIEETPSIYRLSLDRRQPQKITSFAGLNSTPEVSPDHKTLAVTLSKDGNSEIYLMTISNRELVRLTFNKGIDTSPAWSPTGREIVFTSDRAGSPQLYVMDAEGTNLRRLTYNGTYNDSAAWSPQGNIIAYASRQGGKFDIKTITVDGSKIRQLTSGKGNNENPSFSPDGNFIIFSSTRDGSSQIFIMDKFGNNQRRLTFQSGNATAPDWSP